MTLLATSASRDLETALDPVDIHFYFHFSTNFCSFLRKIFRNIPDIIRKFFIERITNYSGLRPSVICPKNFTQKSLKISEKLKTKLNVNRV
jgi:hypothetical protein